MGDLNFNSNREHEIKGDEEGGISSVVLPDPIPNSEVKHAWADDTLTHVRGKVGSCPSMFRLRNISPKADSATGGARLLRHLD